ncbi:hypothetical protein KCU73_g34, partial [Aureobasidium melanogenum]
MTAPNVLVASTFAITTGMRVRRNGKRLVASSERPLLYKRAKAPRAATPAIPIGPMVAAALVDLLAAELAEELALAAALLAEREAELAEELAELAEELAEELPEAAALLALLDAEDAMELADEAREDRVLLADESAEEAELPEAVATAAALVPDEEAEADPAHEAAVSARTYESCDEQKDMLTSGDAAGLSGGQSGSSNEGQNSSTHFAYDQKSTISTKVRNVRLRITNDFLLATRSLRVAIKSSQRQLYRAKQV